MKPEFREEALFFGNSSGVSLFGVLHHSQERPATGAVFCNPLGEEKQTCYRPFVAFSRRLARAGVPSLRFDCLGSGDSEGEASEATIATQISDLRDAVGLATSRLGIEKVVLIGLRLGASVAALTAEEDERVCALALLSPIVDGAKYWSELLRKQQFAAIMIGARARKKAEMLDELDKTGLIEIEAQMLSADMVDQLSGIDLASVPSRFRGPVLVTGLADDETGQAESQRFLSGYHAIGCDTESWFEETQDYWTARGMYDAYKPEQTFERVTAWIQRC